MLLKQSLKSSQLMADKPSTTKEYRNTVKKLGYWPGKHRIAVGLSGGVDSSLTAALLVDAGWEVEGITLWIMSGKGTCCSEGLVDAAGICEQLKIPHHIVDSKATFRKEIINELVQGYQEGITPLPCSKCNRSVKFANLIAWAKAERKIGLIATGHYARIRNWKNEPIKKTVTGDSTNRHQLLRGLDKRKDQSYFLYDLSQEVLENVIFPLGELTKQDTRKEAERYGLRTAKKPESQDLCLAEHYGSMKTFLDTYIPPRNGEIILKDGTVLGNHDGIEHFTIGQRKGLGVSWKEPLFVIRLDSSKNQVIVASRSEASESKCIVGAINWVSIEPPQEPIEVEVQIRYKSLPAKAKLIPTSPTDQDISNKRPYRCILEFNEEQFSITPGQAAVFYEGEILLGGGLIQQIHLS